MRVNIINQQEIKKINSKKIKEIVKSILIKEIGDKKSEINILIADDETIKNYNKYRGKDEPTDVLSFAYGLSQSIIGDIVISVESIERQAGDFGNTFEEEFFYILIHGVLHIIGYDHEVSEEEAKKMFKIQDEYFERLVKRR
ncbi:rRNA maturation RNase YbeY [Petrotoga sp. 9PWA.NaAc.5.4]|uniref:rRNA maturation RNase YbeY n=1 Tax=Petrotoga sp. 9PWA.NaAc.5.4 TaxID=1434328 RepID=UPI000CB14271|nr:rRNA maturation RNase YbeY [Petrotoga sp. 9PWA.NaAc.5.4]PNR96721.1 rRNA maturation factor [Petrotoga sp. 9PWA.NaAc.5.4]